MNTSILSISLDSNIVTQNYADAMLRQESYAKYFKDYTIIILNSSKNKTKEFHKQNLHIYGTNSVFKPFAIFKAVFMASRLSKKYKFDVVTTQDPLATGLVGLLVKLYLKIPLNIQLHSTFCFEKGWKEESFVNYFLSHFIKFLLKFADSVRVVNPKVIRKLEKYTQNLVLIKHIPMVVDLDFFYKKAKLKRTYTKFISMGRLSKEKNFELLIKSFNKVNKKFPHSRLTIVGDGQERQNLKNLITNLDLEPKISLLGMLTRDQVKKELWNSDMFVLSSNYEGWPMVFIEAFSAGLPIITTNVGSAGYIALNNQNSIVVNSNDQNEMEKAMTWIIEHPREAFKFSNNGQELVMAEYNIDKLIEQWVDLLKETKFKN